ncbi:MAG: hypothetical protein SFW67_22635 [Myxococcaceae bacterium]|nr:hypothetical protein [Myxococcaceae bacterium]
MTEPRFTRSFIGQVQSQVVPGELLGDAGELERTFGEFLARTQRTARVIRVGVSLLLVVGLAFVASRVESPLAVGLCGLLVLAPLVWLSTAVFVPMALLGRSKLAAGGGLSMQVGVPIEADEQGFTVGELRFAWDAVTAITEDGEALVVRGVDRPARRLFRVVLAPRSFSSVEDRRAALAALRSRMTTAPK